MMEKRFVYADNAATTKISDRVLAAMMPVLTDEFGNPSSVHSLGRSASRLLIEARERAAAAVGGEPSGEYFTSGGTESDNWAVRGAAELGENDGRRHIITTAIEHHAVLRPCELLEKRGFEVTYLAPDEYGLITPQQVERAIRPDTCLVSVMTANNEIGTIQPVAEIGAVCRERGVLFHTDAVQAVGHIPVDVGDMNIDLLSLSGHKIHAPKGVGLLYVKNGVKLPAFILGGDQQRGRRAGTENLPGIVGLGQALADCTADISGRNERLTSLRNELAEGLLKIPQTLLNGHPALRLAGNVNISIAGIEGESLLLKLETMGIYASSGAACASGSLEPSHVLTAIGMPEQFSRGSLRLTLGDDATREDIRYIIESVTSAVAQIRAVSPLWARLSSE